ncbi:MAG: pseudouridine synthase [Bacteroidota bacterium]|jgi:23S rRNA pseudouridine2457 synthase|nr:pseudouridine synthase [Bacteroidota bacterium]
MKPSAHQYFIVYKPYQVLSQFTATDGKKCLKDYFTVPKNVYPVGRLDFDSEGLLLLTNDSSLNKKLLNPQFAHEREYWVQVDGAITLEAILQLQKGVTIQVDGKKYCTLPCKAQIFKTAPSVPERIPPIRFRKQIPAPWMQLTLTEGKNRQVRKMTAAVGFPTLRLIRYRIGNITANGLLPGDMRCLSALDVAELLAANI